MDQKEYKLAAIMFTTIHGFSGMLEKDESSTLSLLSHHNALLKKLIAEHSGNVIRTLGDSFLADFGSTTDAVRCAVKIQEEIAVFNRSGGTGSLRLRIGLHLGDIHFFEGDAIGEGINIATHLQSLAQPGGICISKEVHDQVSSKLDLDCVSIGRAKPEHISREIYAYRIGTEKSGHPRDTEQTSRAGDEPLDFLGNDLSARIKERIERKISRKIDRYERRHGGTRVPSATAEMPDYRPQKRTWASYVEHARKESERSTTNFTTHFTSYLIANAGLFAVNFLTFFGYKWFLWPLTAWGIGIVCHWLTARTKRKRKQATERLPDLSIEAKDAFHRLYITERNFTYHTGAYLAVIGFLFFTNAFTWFAFPWFLIVAAAWGIGLALHAGVFIPKRIALKKKFMELIGKAGAIVGGKKGREHAAESETVREAFALRDSILREIDSYGKKNSPFDTDMRPLLEQYTNQIRELDARFGEIEALVGSIPMDDLAIDRSKLEDKITRSPSDYMKKEYEKAIDEIDRHRHSFGELNNQKEIIGLRLKSSINNLKQLSIDLARMKGMSIAPDSAAVSLIKDKTHELSQYLDDLRESYKELDENP